MTRSVLFDASRLLSRVERTAPTGVDRVCLAYAEWLLRRDDIDLVPVRTRKDRLVAIDPEWFRDNVTAMRSRWTGAFFERSLTPDEMKLMTALNGESAARQSVIGKPPDQAEQPAGRRGRTLRRLLHSRWQRQLPRASHYFNIGHTGLDEPRILAELSSQSMERVIFLHDLIPITHPEFCRPGDGDKHRVRVINALRHATRIIVNSHYTAEELSAFAEREGLRPPPIDAVHLGLEPTFMHRPTAPARRPYFVHVGTIEARKNLAFLLTIWRRLQERMGARAPQLVLVGRYGWENEAVLDHLERSPPLRGLVHQAADLPDSALATLISGARALLAPSAVEGFDLPAVEASALRVPLIASDIPAHRELVPHAVLIDPLDGLGWLEALETATRTAAKAPAYSPPTWDHHFSQVGKRLGLD